MGDGTLPLPDVPFAVTVSAGSLGLILNAVALPTATVTAGGDFPQKIWSPRHKPPPPRPAPPLARVCANPPRCRRPPRLRPPRTCCPIKKTLTPPLPSG